MHRVTKRREWTVGTLGDLTGRARRRKLAEHSSRDASGNKKKKENQGLQKRPKQIEEKSNPTDTPGAGYKRLKKRQKQGKTRGGRPMEGQATDKEDLKSRAQRARVRKCATTTGSACRGRYDEDVQDR